MKYVLSRLDYYPELIEGLFKNHAGVLASNFFVPLGIVYMLYGFAPIEFIVLFIGGQFLAGLMRFIFSKKGLEALDSHRDKLSKKYLVYTLGMLFFSSLLLGMASIFTVYYAQQLQVFIMVSIVFGLISGSTFTLASVFHAVVVFMSPFIILFIMGLSFSGIDLYYILAVILLLYIVITLPASFRLYLILKTNIDKTKKIIEQNELIVLNQTQLIQSAKMAQMGEMIGNIAHQWRQPLSLVSSVASKIKLNYQLGMQPDPKEIEGDMDLLLDKAHYLSSTIDTFRDFIKEEKEFKEVVLQDRIDTALNIVKDTLKSFKIDFINAADPSPIRFKTVVGELDQVIINIINNAKDALLENYISNPWVKLDVYQEENRLIITIEDNAGGIPEEILPKIFNPYFTTKHQSQGTGLGLHMSYKIMSESLKGTLYVKNTENGAKFFIEHPL
jgi:signal transduction histidine kinase